MCLFVLRKELPQFFQTKDHEYQKILEENFMFYVVIIIMLPTCQMFLEL